MNRGSEVVSPDLFAPAFTDEQRIDAFAMMGLAFVMDFDAQFVIDTDHVDEARLFLLFPPLGAITRRMKEIGPVDGLMGENAAPAWPLPNVRIAI